MPLLSPSSSPCRSVLLLAGLSVSSLPAGAEQVSGCAAGLEERKGEGSSRSTHSFSHTHTHTWRGALDMERWSSFLHGGLTATERLVRAQPLSAPSLRPPTIFSVGASFCCRVGLEEAVRSLSDMGRYHTS